MHLSIIDLKVYVPSKNFEESQRFYRALGFTMSEGWGGTADFELSGHRFRLQNYYNKDWAENFMFVVNVADVEAWHQRAKELVDSGGFSNVRFTPPEQIDGAQVLHIWDPCGVLLIFVQ